MFNKQKEEKVLETILEGTKSEADTYTITHDEADKLTDEMIREKSKSWNWGFYVGVAVAVAGLYLGSKIGD